MISCMKISNADLIHSVRVIYGARRRERQVLRCEFIVYQKLVKKVVVACIDVHQRVLQLQDTSDDGIQQFTYSAWYGSKIGVKRRNVIFHNFSSHEIISF